MSMSDSGSESDSDSNKFSGVPFEILKNCQINEKQVSELRENAKENGPEISRILNALRNDYRRLVIEFAGFSKACSKDIDGTLWKQCFYKQIEEFRRSIRKTIQVIEDQTSSGTMSERAKQHLARLTQAFTKFLMDSSLFYQDFLLQLEAKQQSSKRHHGEIKKCIHRCLLYLGDLARYKELYSENQDKDYSEAERYYERAAFLYPFIGHPQNQLAVLATYVESDCIAFYHYCRSILVREPFGAGFDNLKLLFEKNVRPFSQLRQVGYQQMIAHLAANAHGEKSKKIIAAKVKVFLTQFIRMHGILFHWTRETKSAMEAFLTRKAEWNMHRDNLPYLSEGGGSDETKPSMSVPPLDLEEFLELNQTVLDEFDQLLATSAFGDQLLVRLLVIAIFTVHHSSSAVMQLVAAVGNATPTPTSRPNELNQLAVPEQLVQIASEPHPHTISESLALIFVYGMVNKAASRISTFVDAGEKKKSPANKILPLLSVFGEWLGEFSLYLSASELSAETPLSENSFGGVEAAAPGGVKESLADAALLRAESRARSGMRSAFSLLKEYIDANVKSDVRSGGQDQDPFLSSKLWVPHFPSNGTGMAFADAPVASPRDLRPLREHIELQGFLPLNKQYMVFFESGSMRPPAVPPEEVARDRRFNVLRDFLRDGLVPAAAREAADAENRRALKAQHAADAGVAGGSVTESGRSPMPKGMLYATGLQLMRPKEKIEKARARRKDKGREGTERGGRGTGTPSGSPAAVSGGMAGAASFSQQAKRKPKSGDSKDREWARVQTAGRRRNEDDGGKQQHDEEFPPLPTLKQKLHAKSQLNFASSAMFTGVIPNSSNPFDDDDDDDDDQIEGSDNDSRCGAGAETAEFFEFEDGDDGDLEVSDLVRPKEVPSNALGSQHARQHEQDDHLRRSLGLERTNSSAHDTTVGADVSGMGIFASSFGSAGSSSRSETTLFGQGSSYGSRSAVTVAELSPSVPLGMPSSAPISAIAIVAAPLDGTSTSSRQIPRPTPFAPPLQFDDDEVDDDVVVFRPAFSRVPLHTVDSSPPPPQLTNNLPAADRMGTSGAAVSIGELASANVVVGTGAGTSPGGLWGSTYSSWEAGPGPGPLMAHEGGNKPLDKFSPHPDESFNAWWTDPSHHSVPSGAPIQQTGPNLLQGHLGTAGGGTGPKGYELPPSTLFDSGWTGPGTRHCDQVSTGPDSLALAPPPGFTRSEVGIGVGTGVPQNHSVDSCVPFGATSSNTFAYTAAKSSPSVSVGSRAALGWGTYNERSQGDLNNVDAHGASPGRMMFDR